MTDTTPDSLPSVLFVFLTETDVSFTLHKKRERPVVCSSIQSFLFPKRMMFLQVIVNSWDCLIGVTVHRTFSISTNFKSIQEPSTKKYMCLYWCKVDRSLKGP